MTGFFSVIPFYGSHFEWLNCEYICLFLFCSVWSFHQLGTAKVTKDEEEKTGYVEWIVKINKKDSFVIIVIECGLVMFGKQSCVYKYRICVCLFDWSFM